MAITGVVLDVDMWRGLKLKKTGRAKEFSRNREKSSQWLDENLKKVGPYYPQKNGNREKESTSSSTEGIRPARKVWTSGEDKSEKGG